MNKYAEAKSIIDSLANGLNPATGEKIDDAVMNQPEVIRTMFFVSNLLRELSEGETVKDGNQRTVKTLPFTMTEEERHSVRIDEGFIGMHDFVARINAAINQNKVERVHYRNLLRWLAMNNMVEEYIDANDELRRRATEEGEQYGFLTEIRQSEYGEYTRISLNVHGQEFILNNAERICREAIASLNENTTMFGEPWSVEDERYLAESYKSGETITKIAFVLRRSSGGVYKRLEQLGLVAPSKE